MLGTQISTVRRNQINGLRATGFQMSKDFLDSFGMTKEQPEEGIYSASEMSYCEDNPGGQSIQRKTFYRLC